MNKDDLVSLSWENKRKFRAAIEQGYFDDYEDNPREWKHSFVGTFIRRYPQRCATLNRIRNLVGHIPRWEDLDDDLLRDYVDDVRVGVASSSARTMCSELKGVLNENKRKIPSTEFRRVLSVKGEASQAVFLTREEVMRIINYRPVTELERFVRRTFLIIFMTGARRCDAERLTIHNCDMDTGTLSYVPQKTPNIVVTVPVDERLKLRTFLAENDPRPCDRATFNDTLRRICQECGIDRLCSIQRRGEQVTEPKWKLVSSHTARRSFATNLYLAGVSLEDIALLMGHGKNIETTKRYICAERKMASNVMAYFQPPSDDTTEE